jgi:hypothetical protein
MKAGTRVIVRGLDPARGKVGRLLGRQPLLQRGPAGGFPFGGGLFEVELDEGGERVFTSAVTRYKERKPSACGCRPCREVRQILALDLDGGEALRRIADVVARDRQGSHG